MGRIESKRPGRLIATSSKVDAICQAHPEHLGAWLPRGALPLDQPVHLGQKRGQRVVLGRGHHLSTALAQGVDLVEHDQLEEWPGAGTHLAGADRPTQVLPHQLGISPMPDGLQGTRRHEVQTDIEVVLLAEVPHERGERPDERGLPLSGFV